MVNARRYGATYLARMPDSGTATKISGLVRNRDGRMDGRLQSRCHSLHFTQIQSRAAPKEQKNGRIPPKSSSEQEYRNRTEQLKGLPRRPAGIIIEYWVRGH